MTPLEHAEQIKRLVGECEFAEINPDYADLWQ